MKELDRGSGRPADEVFRKVSTEASLVQLHDKDTGARLAQITEEQLQFLINQLEEESATDQDYYIDDATLEMLQGAGADADLIETLRRALGDRDGMEIRWLRL